MVKICAVFHDLKASVLYIITRNESFNNQK